MVSTLALDRVNHEIAVLTCTEDTILYDVPFGITDPETPCTGERVIKRNSIAECIYAALERIGIADSAKLLAMHSPEERTKFIFANKVKRDLVTELASFHECTPLEDHATHLIPPLAAFYKTLNPALAARFIKNFNEIDCLPQEAQRMYFEGMKFRAHFGPTFEIFMDNFKKTKLHCETYLSSSSTASNLYDELFSRTEGKRMHIELKHLKTLGDEDFDRMKMAIMATPAFIEKDDTPFVKDCFVNMHVVQEIFMKKLGLKRTNKFRHFSEEFQRLVDITHARALHGMTMATSSSGGAASGGAGVSLGAHYAATLKERITAEIKSDLGFSPSVPKIDDLIAFLKQNGPFIASGHYGLACYLAKPEPFEGLPSIGERAVYAWKKGALKVPLNQSLHVITIIGTKKYSADNGLVFFLDPIDKSDPTDHSLERIYATSFKNFLESHAQSCYTPNAGVAARSM